MAISTFIILLFQNILLFSKHYFENNIFPWDFTLSYTATPIYVQKIINNFSLHEWMPYQNSGYPLVMNAQSGLFFPIFWLLTLLRVKFTIHNLVMIQTLHILLGSIGFYFLTKLFIKNKNILLIASLSFQFFGGFYSNAEHADIIRSFCYIPWLLYASTFFLNKSSHIKRALLLPLFLTFLITGGYPGIFISFSVIFSIYSLAQLFFLLSDKNRKAWFLFFTNLIFFILGILISSSQLGPLILYKSQLTRSTVLDNSFFWSLSFKDLANMFLNNWYWNTDPTMYLMYFPVPIIFSLFLLKTKTLKRYFPILNIFIFALFMAIGKYNPGWVMLTNFFPILKMSRFPIGDYKIFIIISIILFSLIELQTNLQKITKKETIINILKLLFIYFLLNISALIIYKDDLFKRNMHFLLLNTLYLTYFIYAIKNKKINFYLLLILISLDGIFFLKTYKNPTQKVNTWQLSWPQFVLQRDETINNNSSLSTFTRPPRIDEKKYPNSILDGYLSNKFIAGDYGGTKLNNLQIINSNTIYNKYLNKEWQALFINCNSKDVICDKNYIQIQDDNFFNQDYKNDIVSQMIYQTDTILYKINSENDFIFTENEIFFPGWNGYINGKQFKSIPTNKVFRTWNLPKGNYYFLAKFDLPYQKTFYFVSIISVIFYIYLTIHIIVFKNNKFIYQANKIK